MDDRVQVVPPGHGGGEAHFGHPGQGTPDGFVLGWVYPEPEVGAGVELHRGRREFDVDVHDPVGDERLQPAGSSARGEASGGREVDDAGASVCGQGRQQFLVVLVQVRDRLTTMPRRPGSARPS